MASGTITKVIPDSGAFYCKMPDGTLICWGRGSANNVSGTTEVNIAQTFGVAYYGIPAVILALRGASYNRRIHPRDITLTGFNAACAFTSSSSSGDIWFDWVALGRWKA